MEALSVVDLNSKREEEVPGDVQQPSQGEEVVGLEPEQEASEVRPWEVVDVKELETRKEVT